MPGTARATNGLARLAMGREPPKNRLCGELGGVAGCLGDGGFCKLWKLTLSTIFRREDDRWRLCERRGFSHIGSVEGELGLSGSLEQNK